MKTRTGFVSNSSTSSYIIYGWRFDIDELDTVIKHFNIVLGEEDGEDHYSKYEKVGEFLRDNNIDHVVLNGGKFDTLLYMNEDYGFMMGVVINDSIGTKELQEMCSDAMINKLKEMFPFTEGDPSICTEAFADY